MRHLSYFRVVADLGSIAKAAATLRVTQPTLSRQLMQLERSLGYPLLVRTTRGTSLTPAGQGLYDHLQGVFDRLEQVPEVLRSSHARHRVINVGVPPGMPHEWFTSFRLSAQARDTRLRFAVLEATSEEQSRLILNGRLDLGLIHAKPAGLSSTRVLTQRLGCAFKDPRSGGASVELTFADADGLHVMAHAQSESPGEETRLRAAAAAAGARVEWMFRPFSHHGRLIAEAADVDAVVVGAETAHRDFAGWHWYPFRRDLEGIHIDTWAAWSELGAADAELCVSAMRNVSTRVSTTEPTREL